MPKLRQKVRWRRDANGEIDDRMHVFTGQSVIVGCAVHCTPERTVYQHALGSGTKRLTHRSHASKAQRRRAGMMRPQMLPGTLCTGPGVDRRDTRGAGYRVHDGARYATTAARTDG